MSFTIRIILKIFILNFIVPPIFGSFEIKEIKNTTTEDETTELRSDNFSVSNTESEILTESIDENTELTYDKTINSTPFIIVNIIFKIFKDLSQISKFINANKSWDTKFNEFIRNIFTQDKDPELVKTYICMIIKRFIVVNIVNIKTLPRIDHFLNFFEAFVEFLNFKYNSENPDAIYPLCEDGAFTNFFGGCFEFIGYEADKKSHGIFFSVYGINNYVEFVHNHELQILEENYKNFTFYDKMLNYSDLKIEVYIYPIYLIVKITKNFFKMNEESEQMLNVKFYDKSYKIVSFLQYQDTCGLKYYSLVHNAKKLCINEICENIKKNESCSEYSYGNIHDFAAILEILN